jgi:phage-related protein
MESPTEILPGVIFYSYLSSLKKEKACVWNHHTLVLQVSGQMVLETADSLSNVVDSTTENVADSLENVADSVRATGDSIADSLKNVQ